MYRGLGTIEDQSIVSEAIEGGTNRLPPATKLEGRALGEIYRNDRRIGSNQWRARIESLKRTLGDCQNSQDAMAEQQGTEESVGICTGTSGNGEPDPITDFFGYGSAGVLLINGVYVLQGMIPLPPLPDSIPTEERPFTCYRTVIENTSIDVVRRMRDKLNKDPDAVLTVRKEDRDDLLHYAEIDGIITPETPEEAKRSIINKQIRNILASVRATLQDNHGIDKRIGLTEEDVDRVVAEWEKSTGIASRQQDGNQEESIC